MAEIPFWVYDRPKWVSGITPTTTCQDILRSLSTFLPTAEPGDDRPKLVLTEKWRDVERPLPSEAQILKIWTAWGDERKFVKFVVKRVSQRSNHRKRLRRYVVSWTCHNLSLTHILFIPGEVPFPASMSFIQKHCRSRLAMERLQTRTSLRK